MTCKSPVGDISVVTLIRTDTTLDHSQKAEKVCSQKAEISVYSAGEIYVVFVFVLQTTVLLTSVLLGNHIVPRQCARILLVAARKLPTS